MAKYKSTEIQENIITGEELSTKEIMLRIENQDKREDAQRRMAWFALFGMLLYPAAIVLAFLVKLDQAAIILGDMAPTYFVSVAAIVIGFYGKTAYENKDNHE